MGFQLLFFGNRNWENGQEKTNFLNKARRFIFGSHIYYDPPLKKGGETFLASSTPPIWERFYNLYLYQLYFLSFLFHLFTKIPEYRFLLFLTYSTY